MYNYLKKVRVLIKDGFLHILAGSTLNKAIAFISSILIVRLVSKSDYGVLTYVDNLYSYVLLFTGLGMSTAIMKYCTISTKPESDYKYLSFSLKCGCITQLLLTMVLVLYSWIADSVLENAQELLYLKFLYPCMAFAVTLLQNYVRSQGDNKKYAYISVLQTGIILFFSIGLTLLMGVSGVIIARYIGLVVALVVLIKYVRKIIPRYMSDKLSVDEIKSYLKISISIMIADIFTTIIPINELFIVSSVISDETVIASYKIATLIPSQLMFIASSIVIYLFPKIAQEKKFSDAFNKVKKSALACFVMISCITVIGILFNKYIILLIYGNAYLDSIRLSNIYWVVYMINAGLRILPVQMMAALGKAKANAYISVITALLHVVLFYIAISKFDLYVGAIATGGIYLISTVMLWIVLVWYKKSLNENY